MKEAPGTSSQATGQHTKLERFRNYLRFLADTKLDRRLRSRVDPSDIVQEALLRAYTGLSWKIKATTLWGGTALTLYLIVLIASLAYRPQVAIGVYMAVGGAVVFAIGIVLSIYRDKLLEIPEQVANRKGVFRILNWR